MKVNSSPKHWTSIVLVHISLPSMDEYPDIIFFVKFACFQSYRGMKINSSPKHWTSMVLVHIFLPALDEYSDINFLSNLLVF